MTLKSEETKMAHQESEANKLSLESFKEYLQANGATEALKNVLQTVKLLKQQNDLLMTHLAKLQEILSKLTGEHQDEPQEMKSDQEMELCSTVGPTEDLPVALEQNDDFPAVCDSPISSNADLNGSNFEEILNEEEETMSKAERVAAATGFEKEKMDIPAEQTDSVEQQQFSSASSSHIRGIPYVSAMASLASIIKAGMPAIPDNMIRERLPAALELLDEGQLNEILRFAENISRHDAFNNSNVLRPYYASNGTTEWRRSD